MKKLLAAISLIPALAFAQSYPSPTYNVLTLQTPLALTSGGTGSATQAGALSNILGSSAVPVLNGGTGSTTASGARTNLGAASTGANTFSGNQTISLGSGSAAMIVSSISGSTKQLNFQTAGSDRWILLSTSGAESGGNAGSDFNLLARSDSGTALSTPLSIVRSTGVASFAQRPVFNSATPWDSANLNFATPPAIGATTPNTGKFTTLQATSTITPSSTAGIVGTTTNDNANAGSVGEYISSASTATALTTATSANIASASLTAGDWDVQCEATYNAAAATTVTLAAVGVSTTSATLPASNSGARAKILATFGGSGGTSSTVELPTPVTRLSLSATTTAFCVTNAGFSGGTLNSDGFIRARRVR